MIWCERLKNYLYFTRYYTSCNVIIQQYDGVVWNKFSSQLSPHNYFFLLRIRILCLLSCLVRIVKLNRVMFLFATVTCFCYQEIVPPTLPLFSAANTHLHVKLVHEIFSGSNSMSLNWHVSQCDIINIL